MIRGEEEIMAGQTDRQTGKTIGQLLGNSLHIHGKLKLKKKKGYSV